MWQNTLPRMRIAARIALEPVAEVLQRACLMVAVALKEVAAYSVYWTGSYSFPTIEARRASHAIAHRPVANVRAAAQIVGNPPAECAATALATSAAHIPDAHALRVLRLPSPAGALQISEPSQHWPASPPLQPQGFLPTLPPNSPT